MKSFAVLLALLAAALPTLAAEPKPASDAKAAAAGSARRNVLFIVTDDQRWDTVAALGNAEIKTPTFDALAERGFVFRNAFCMGSMIGAVCAPSRTMIMTGRSLWRIPAPNARSWEGASLGSVFRQAGYATLFVGKRGNTFLVGNAAFETVVYDETRPDKAGRAGSSRFHADTAIEWLGKQPTDKPFLLYFAPPVPHDPRQAPPEFHTPYPPDKVTLSKNFMPRHPFDNGELTVRDEKLAPLPRTEAEMRQHLSDYYATISNLDREIGRVIEAIKARGELERTLIVFTSDQGLAVGGRHGLMGKQNLYEHVKPPLILAGPGIAKGQSNALVYLYDLLPTVCEYAGLPTPDGVEGRSLLPVVAGKQPRVRETLFAAYRDCQRMIRDERWKLLTYRTPNGRNTQLFDLSADPDELRNLADDPQHSAQRKRLEELLTQARRDFADPVDWDSEPKSPKSKK